MGAVNSMSFILYLIIFMKKNTLKAFTLVEMLIVIVIIGILIAALLPRMQSAQGRARDVSRKTALSQIQSAIVTYQTDHGDWPKKSDATNWTGIQAISSELQDAWMSTIPTDPLSSTTFGWLGSTTITSGDYGYIVTKRSWKSDAGFVLMAATEVAWWSNWVVCSWTNIWQISNSTDVTQLVLCSSVEKKSGQTCQTGTKTDQKCYYENDSELRYIVLY